MTATSDDDIISDDDELSRLGRRSALGLAGAAASGVATITTLVIASRGLSGNETGEFFVAISIFSIVQGLGSLGADTGLQYWVPTLSMRGRRALIKRVWTIVAAAGLATAIVVVALARPIGELLAGGDSAPPTSLVRLIAVLLPVAPLYEATLGGLRSCDWVKTGVLLDRFVRPIGQVLAMILVWSLGGGSTMFTLAWAAPYAITMLVAVTMLARRLNRHRLQQIAGGRDSLAMSEFWRYTAPRAVARAAQSFTQRLDVILLASLVSLRDAGIYGTVSRCMIAGVFVATAVQQVVQPRLRRLAISGDRRALRVAYGASTTWLVVVTWPVYLAMAVFSPAVMRLFGPRFVEGATALTILSLTMLVASACGLVDVVLLMVGRSWLSTANVLVALALNVVLNLTLIPLWGLEGAAIAWTAAILTTNVVPLAQLARQGLHPWGPPLRAAMLTAAAAIGGPLLLARLLRGSDFGTLGIALAIALTGYVGALFVLRRLIMLDRLVADLGRRRNTSAVAPT